LNGIVPMQPGAEILPLSAHDRAIANIDKTAPILAAVSSIAAGGGPARRMGMAGRKTEAQRPL